MRAKLTVFLVLCMLLTGLPVGAGNERAPRVARPTSKAKKHLKELFVAWFKADEADRSKILAEVAEHDPIPKTTAKELTKELFKLAARGRKTVGKTKRKLDHPDYPGTFLIHGARPGKKKGLFIGLHGGGKDVGDGANSAQKWLSAQGQDCIAVFPTVIEKTDGAWNRPHEERYVLELIETIKRTYPIDTNRIYLAGHSMGGFGTWSIGGHHADLFAAVSPHAGGLFAVGGNSGIRLATGIIANLLNTPVLFTHGSDDTRVPPDRDRLASEELDALRKEHPGGYVHEYREYDGIGHGLPPRGLVPVIKWVTKRKRNPYPKKVIWEPRVPHKRSFFWLRCDSPGRGRITAIYKGEGEFEIDLGGASDVSLLLSKEMVDFKKPVRVVVDGKERFRGFVTESAATLLDTIGRRNDPEMYFSAQIDL